jgi:hypothetical protein
MNKLDKLHQDAIALMMRMKKTADESDAAETVKGYNERRKTLVAEFKPVLAKMDAAFNRGEQVGGCGGMKEYCKAYRAQGMVTYARVRQILTGKSGNEGKVKSLDLGDTIRIGKRKFKIVSFGDPIAPVDYEDEFGVHALDKEIAGRTHELQLNLKGVVVEEPEVVAPAPPKRPSASFTRHAGKPGDYRTACGVIAKKHGGKRRAGVVFAEGDEKVDCPECLTQAAIPEEEHTGQHDDCVECFEAQQKEEAFQQLQSDYWEVFRKRIQTLINTWRNGRLKDENKYRVEFEKAAAKFEKKVDKLGKHPGVRDPRVITAEARGRMEAAIADRNRHYPQTVQHPAAKALAATEKANKRSKGTNAMPAATAATTGLVKMARIGNTNEFGVFPESCWKCTTANALTIGTRQVCEAERDRINAKRPAKNDSVENPVGAANDIAHGGAHQNQRQHPAAEAVEQLKKTLESVEPITVPGEQEQQCDYTEEEVTQMFAKGGN